MNLVVLVPLSGEISWGAAATLAAAFAVVGALDVCRSSWSNEKSELPGAGVLLT